MAKFKSKQLTSVLNIPTASFDVVSGSLVPDASNTYDLGSSQLPWRELYILSSSINFNNTNNQSVGKLAVDQQGLSLEVGLPASRIKQKIKVDRKGEILTFDINQKKICNYPIIFTQDKIVNAYADGKSIIMTQGMVDYAKDDNEIAMVIAHELAHNDRGHLDAKKKNTLVMGSIGMILDFMMIYYSGGTAGGDAQNTEMWSKIGSEAYSVEFEKDADYGGIYYAYRSGYDISQVKNFWERIGSENPRQIAISSTHPATAERYLQIEKTVDEIKKKKVDGFALVPNEKEIKTENKEPEKKKKKKFDLKKLIKIKEKE